MSYHLLNTMGMIDHHHSLERVKFPTSDGSSLCLLCSNPLEESGIWKPVSTEGAILCFGYINLCGVFP